MEKESKKYEIIQILAGFSVFGMPVGLILSLENQDLRYLAVAISLFGLFYFLALGVYGIMKGYHTSDVFISKIFTSFLLGIWLLLGLIIFIYGISLFMHHYDINWLNDFFCEKALEISNFIKKSGF
jgi:hypothetical protein